MVEKFWKINYAESLKRGKFVEKFPEKMAE